VQLRKIRECMFDVVEGKGPILPAGELHRLPG
jgi:hypothetical protein